MTIKAKGATAKLVLHAEPFDGYTNVFNACVIVNRMSHFSALWIESIIVNIEAISVVSSIGVRQILGQGVGDGVFTLSYKKTFLLK